jgi:hypothetical protein
MGSNLAEDNGLLRAIQIHSKTSFPVVKPLVPCRKILQHVKNSVMSMKKILTGKIHWPFLCQVSPALLLYVSAGN